MAMHRKKKAPRTKSLQFEEPWFKAHRKRSRVRDKMAKLSRRKNRG